MHPIERLRYVARSSGVDQELLVRETASALLSFSRDPHGLVVACQRMIARQPTSGPLVWLCARMLTEPEPRVAARAAVDEIAADTTIDALAEALPDRNVVCVLGWPEQTGEALVRRGDITALVIDTGGEAAGLVRRLFAAESDAVDVPQSGLAAAVESSALVVLESAAIGPEHAICVAGSRAAAAVARELGRPVWLVGGTGRLLPARMFDPMADRMATDEPWLDDEELVPIGLVDRVVSRRGVESVSDALGRIDCPIAPELFGGIAGGSIRPGGDARSP